MNLNVPSGHISVTIPTCPTRLCEAALPEKNTRSPGRSWSVEISHPWVYWLRDEAFRLIPNCLKIYEVKPEQSNPPGFLPPER